MQTEMQTKPFAVFLRVCSLVVIISCRGAAAAAGQSLEATIIGQVTDSSGAVLPGVTVSLTSPALQVREVTTVTGPTGDYRLSPLPIGTYVITFSLSGFQTTKRENIRLTSGFVATINIAMGLSSLEESVTVSSSAPVVDVTSTATTTRLTRETLELIPSTRNGVLSLMAQTPSVRGNLDIGGNNFSAVPAFRAYGQNSAHWATLEGVLTEGPIGGAGAGNYWDYSSFEETYLSTVGKDASVPVRGVRLAVIVKSGGNDFHGSGYYGNTNHNFQAQNIDAALIAQGITSGNTLEKQWDGSLDLGGRIVRDKLWFYGAVRDRQSVSDILGVTQDDGSPAPWTQEQRFGTGKLSYQATSGIRFIGFYTKTIKTETPANLTLSQTSRAPWSTRGSGTVPAETMKIEGQVVKGNMIASLQLGKWGFDANYVGYTNEPSTLDLVTQAVSGRQGNSDRTYVPEGRWHNNGTLTWYKPNTFGGSHEIKSGFDFIPEHATIGQRVPPQGSFQLLFRSGVPFEFNTYSDPVAPINLVHYLGVYTSDNWKVSRRLTLNLGLRFVHDNAFAPKQCKDAGPFSEATCRDLLQLKIYKSFAPRVAAAYDLSGKGQTVVKAGWSRYDAKRTPNDVSTLNPLSSITTTYLWHDLNGDKLYQPGEVNLAPGSPDFVSQTAAASGIPNPSQPQPKQDEYFVGFEHELIRDFSVRVTGLYSRYLHFPRVVQLLRPYSVYNIPITSKDPGPDNKVGTSDDPGTSLTYYDYPAAYAGRQFDLNTPDSPAGQPDHTFKTIEVAAAKRFSHGWQLSTSYSATKLNEPVAESAVYTPNAEINTANNAWEWLGRVSGAYSFPYGVQASANLEMRNGAAQARQVLLVGGVRVPSLLVNAEPLGSFYLPTVRNLDLRAEKSFNLRANRKIAVRLNVFNALNANTTLNWVLQSGALFKNPLTIMPPRLFALSATYTF